MVSGVAHPTLGRTRKYHGATEEEGYQAAHHEAGIMKASGT